MGWGSLCVALGGAYYFYKKSINADRQARHADEQKRKELQRRMEAAEFEARNPSTATKPKKKKKVSDSEPDAGVIQTKGLDTAGSPSSDISQDAAPVGHAPATEKDQVEERSKYEAAVPYRSKKGDRFS